MAKRNVVEAPEGVTISQVEDLVQDVFEKVLEVQSEVAEFATENSNKSDEDLGGKIGRVWKKVYLLKDKTFGASKQITSAIQSGVYKPKYPAEMQEIFALRKTIKELELTNERMKKLGLYEDDPEGLEREKNRIRMLEDRIATICRENDWDSEPQPPRRGRKKKDEYED